MRILFPSAKELTNFLRYPSFIDAVRDLDDCLCHIFLFASLPASDKIPAAVIEDARKLGAEFMNYVIYSHSLKKTFLSIKGIYYQVEVKGQEVTWLQPYEFATPIPHDVDLKVMLTFLEFYRCLLGFVNFKLYSEHGLKYPPILKKELEEEGAGSITSFSLVTSTGEVLGEQPKAKVSNSEKKRAELLKKVAQKQMKSLDRKLEEIKESDSTPVPAEIQDEIVLENEEKTNAPAFLFSKHKVFLSREVPRYSLEFVLKTFGATVGWHETSGAGSPYIEDDSSITLEIVDRPVDSIKTIAGRIYVQPQWVYDSINAGALVNEAEYAPGQKLPPHLSPFKPYEALDEVELSDEEEVVIEGESDVEVDIDEDEVITEEPLNEGQVQKQKRIEEDEKVEMAKMMLSNKKRKYVERIQERKKEEQEQKKQLLRKRKQLKA